PSMTPEELRSRLGNVARLLSSAREDLEALIPHLSRETYLEVVRRVLTDVSRAAANCDAVTSAEGTDRPLPFVVSLGPPTAGAIYSLTTIGADQEHGATRYPFGEIQQRMRRRTVGFFWTPEQAEEILVENHGDLDEAGWYRWAVVEAISPGLYPPGQEHQWWEYDLQAEQWKKLAECPAALGEYRERNRVGGPWCEIG